jgi:hypothetical protein
MSNTTRAGRVIRGGSNSIAADSLHRVFSVTIGSITPRPIAHATIAKNTALITTTPVRPNASQATPMTIDVTTIHIATTGRNMPAAGIDRNRTGTPRMISSAAKTANMIQSPDENWQSKKSDGG